MMRMKCCLTIFLCSLFLFSYSVEEDFSFYAAECAKERNMREHFLERCPAYYSDLINKEIYFYEEQEKVSFVPHGPSISAFDEDHPQSKNPNVLWSNDEGNVTVGVGSTGNIFLDALPAPLRAVVVAVKIITSPEVKSGISSGLKWIGNLFKRSLPLQECLDIISYDPYTQKVFHRIHEIRDYINDINSSNLLRRINARMNLLEADLPPPYNKKLKRSLAKLRKACANWDGELVNYEKDIDAEKIFGPYLKQNYIVPEKFIKKIPKMKNAESYAPKEAVSKTVHRHAFHLIQNQAKMTFIELTKFCNRYRHQLIEYLYQHFSQQRAQVMQEKIAQDPQSSRYPAPEKILRNFYQKELEAWLSEKPVHEKTARDQTYNALNGVNIRKPPPGYEFGMLDRFVKNACKGMEQTNQKVKEAFFDESGILKKYSNDPYVQKHFASCVLDSVELHQAVNYALAMYERTDSHRIKTICYEIMHQASLSLSSVDGLHAQIFQENAYRLYQLLASTQGKGFATPQMDAARRKEYEQLQIGHDKKLSKAYEQAREEGFKDYQQKHEISHAARGFMLHHGMNHHTFSEVTGNVFQHALTQDLIAMINEAAQSKGFHFDKDFSLFASLSQDYNHLKKLAQSVDYRNLCKRILKYGEAINLGVGYGFIGAGQFLMNPLSSIIGVAQGLKKVTTDILDYAFFDCVGFEDKKEEIIAYYTDMAKGLKAAYDNSTGPECVQMAVQIAVEQLVIHTSIGAISKVSSRLKGKYAQAVPMTDQQLFRGIAQKSEQVSELALAEGWYCVDNGHTVKPGSYFDPNELTHVHKISDPRKVCKHVVPDKLTLPNNIISKKKALLPNQIKKAPKKSLINMRPMRKKKYTPRKPTPQLIEKVKNAGENFIEIELDSSPLATVGLPEKLKSKAYSLDILTFMGENQDAIPPCYTCLEQALNIAAEGPLEVIFNGKQVKMEFRIAHYSLPEFKFPKNKFENKRLEGFHLDCGGKIAEKGIIKINKLAERAGAYWAEIIGFDIPGFKKTFFPEHWDPDMIKKKIFEAFNNMELRKINSSNTFTYVGTTECGMDLRFFIEVVSEDEIILRSACPDLIWVQKGLL